MLRWRRPTEVQASFQLGFADSSQEPEESLLKHFIAGLLVELRMGLRIASRIALRLPLRFEARAGVTACGVALLAILLASSTPVLFAQRSQSPSSSSAPTPAPPQSAQAQGQAETSALNWLLANSGPFHGEFYAQPYRVAFTVTPSEGWWDKAANGGLVWHDPPANNFHLRIFVMDLADGRFVPALRLHATLTDANGNQQVAPVDYGWYPLLNAYGANVPLYADSAYVLRVAIDPLSPPSPGEPIIHTVTAEFRPVSIAQDALSVQPLITSTAAANEAALLKPLNAALTSAITELWQHSLSGAENPAGDYFVSYALDYSGLTLPLGNAKLRLKKLVEFAGLDEVRLALLFRDSRTGRLIPGLKARAELVAADGKSYGPDELSFSAHPWLSHYGRNARIPHKGLYTLHVHFDAPGFRRWGAAGERFALPADVEFSGLSLKPEKQPAHDAASDAHKDTVNGVVPGVVKDDTSDATKDAARKESTP